MNTETIPTNVPDDHAETKGVTIPLDPNAAVVHPVVTFPAVAGFYWGKKKGANEWQFIVRVSGTAPFLEKNIKCHIVPRALPIHIHELDDFDFGPRVQPPKYFPSAASNVEPCSPSNS